MYIYHPLTTLTCPFVFITHTHFQVIIFPALTHNTRVYTFIMVGIGEGRARKSVCCVGMSVRVLVGLFSI